MNKPLRLWPGVAAALLMVLVSFVLPAVAPEADILGMDAAIVSILGGMVGALLVLVWWLFFSRIPWFERLGAVVVIVLAAAAIQPLTHVSIQNGMQGMMFFIYAIPPTIALALVGWAAASRGLTIGRRRAALVAAIVAGCSVWTLARTNGLLGGAPDLEWRWTPDAEQRLLAQSESLDFARDRPVDSAPDTPLASVGSVPAAPLPAPALAEAAAEPLVTEAGDKAAATPDAAASERVPRRIEWPGFRGPSRDGVVRGVRINTDWPASPPVEMWRRPIGPGWSSFAVNGDRLYTQEQRGDDEIVASYKVSTGEPIWRHRDATRFWESNGGAGPRATPTLHGDRVYAFGATGILNTLDAGTGKLVWSRNVATDSGRQVPDWGFSSSPLVVDDVVIVAAAGTLVGYDLITGERRWLGPSYGGSYSSPHRAIFDGVVQVVLLGGPGVISVAPATGAVLWQHDWVPGAIVQPALTPDGDILVNSMSPTGGGSTRRLHVTRGAGGWTAQERWTSIGLKPYFNDFVVHNGHAFGFDGSILACIGLEDGARKWKGGRFGNGQLVLLADQDLLLVLSEDGELALVKASTDQFTEVARFPALNAKTWNHPVVVGNVLLVRNGEEMAAFRLPLAGR